MEASSISADSRVNSLFYILMEKLSWGIVSLFLIFLPFQKYLLDRFRLSRGFLWTDEIFVVVVLGLFFLILFYKWRMKSGAFQILVVLFLFCIMGIFSGLWNNNRFIVSANGIFDYIKNFLPIPIFCLFKLQKRKVKSLYKILHRLALFFCLVAILQEIAFFLGYSVSGMVRFGFLRTPSLLGHPNAFGLYALLFFILDFSLYRRVRWQNLVFIMGIFFSVSRMVWAAFFIAYFYLLIQGKDKKSVRSFALVIILIALSVPSFYLHTYREMGSEHYYRGYVLAKSIEIWEDHPVMGVGPGMYGGVVSVVFNSPVYEEYDFSQKWYDYGLKGFHSLDQFWPQCLAETGLIGIFIFIALLFVLWRIAKRIFLITKDPFCRNILTGFSAMPIVLAVYLLGGGLNLSAILLTYTILFGMILGIKDESIINK